MKHNTKPKQNIFKEEEFNLQSVSMKNLNHISKKEKEMNKYTIV